MFSAPLPTPNEAAQQHSAQLSERIREDIAAHQGRISFSRFMHWALYTPNLGYYQTQSDKFGVSGDFITAPEISPVFAQCIANTCAPILHEIPNADFLEIGAGSGRFAQTILRALAALNALPQHYYIVEISTTLRAQQEKLLREQCPEFLSRVIWLEKFPDNFNGIMFANEILDALPIDCFTMHHGVKERCVAWQDNQFSWHVCDPVTPHLKESIHALDLAEHYESEMHSSIPSWIATLARSLKKGIFLTFDYGYGAREYYHPDRFMGTLMCHYQHHRHSNPLVWPGLQDITAHVNFTAVAESAVSAGLTLMGYTTQAAFLMASGLTEILQQQSVAGLDYYRRNQAMKQLLLPSEMGEMIKVMALGKNISTPLPAFALHDRRRDL